MKIVVDLGKIGITVSEAGWDDRTSYERLVLLEHNSLSWLSIKANQGIEPGTNPLVWKQIGSTSSSGGGTIVEIVNDLTTGGADKALSAEMGKAINVALIGAEDNLARLNTATENMQRQIDALDPSGDIDYLSAFKSIVFVRNNTKPDTPSSGAGGGSFENPVPSGWYDGIPSGVTKLWMTSRWFYSDPAKTALTTWSEPSQVTDTSNIDFEFSAVISPGNPTSNPTYWHNDATENDIWMAVRVITNGTYGPWQIAKIKGEQGPQGVKGDDGTSIRITGTAIVISDIALATDHDKFYYLAESSGGFSAGTIIAYDSDDSQWEAVAADSGDAYIVNGHIYAWDGDSWADCGQFTGEPGQSQYLFTAFSDDGGATLTSNDGLTPGRYWGYCVLNVNTRPLTASSYTWTPCRGEDGFGWEFIYKRTTTASAPVIPESVNVDEYEPSGWTDDPQDVDAEYPYCWMCVRKKTNGIWGNYIGSSQNTGYAALWAKYGNDGDDGDNGVDGEGYEHVFIRTSTNVAPTIVTSADGYEDSNHHVYTDDDFLPLASGGSLVGSVECTDEPQGPNANYPYEWVVTRKKGAPDASGVRTWPKYSGTMTLWAVWREDLDFLKDFFGEENVDSHDGVILRDLLGVKRGTGASAHVVAMFNASDQIGYDSTHGVLMLAAGMANLGQASGAPTRIYEDGHAVLGDIEMTSIGYHGTYQFKVLLHNLGIFLSKEYSAAADKEFDRYVSLTEDGFIASGPAGDDLIRVNGGDVTLSGGNLNVSNGGNASISGDTTVGGKFSANGDAVLAGGIQVSGIRRDTNSANVNISSEKYLYVADAAVSYVLPSTFEVGESYEIIVLGTACSLKPGSANQLVVLAGGSSSTPGVAHGYTLGANTHWRIIAVTDSLFIATKISA